MNKSSMCGAGGAILWKRIAFTKENYSWRPYPVIMTSVSHDYDFLRWLSLIAIWEDRGIMSLPDFILFYVLLGLRHWETLMSLSNMDGIFIRRGNYRNGIYNVSCVIFYFYSFSLHLFTFWKMKCAKSAMNSSLLLCTTGCTDSYHWVTLIVKKS